MTISVFNKNYDDFYFNGRTLSSMGGIITRDDIYTIKSLLQEREVITTTALGVDGEIFYGVKYGKRIWTETVFFENIENIDDIRNWLNVREPKVFKYIGDQYEIRCIVSSANEMEVYENNNGFCAIFEIGFTAFKPHFIKSSKDRKNIDVIKLGWDSKIHCDGNIDKNYPQLEFIFDGIQDVEIEINGYKFSINEVKSNLIIDSMTREVISNNENRLKDFKGRFPILKCGDNDLKIIKGQFKSLKVLDRAMYL